MPPRHGVQVQLSDGDPHAPGAQVPQAQNPSAVREDDTVLGGSRSGGAGAALPKWLKAPPRQMRWEVGEGREGVCFFFQVRN